MATATATLGSARRRVGGATVLVAAAAVGVALVAVPRSLDRGGDRGFLVDDARSVEALPFDLTSDEPPAAPADVSDAVGPAAPSARAAIERFLDAEISGESDASFEILAAADRAKHPTRAAWASAHDALPEIMGYEITAVRAGDGRAEVDVDLTLVPALDAIVGLVPGRATARFVAVGEDGGWRVAFAESRSTPVHPGDAAAPDAARRWAEGAARDATVAQWTGGVLGLTDDAVAAALRGARGPFVVGDASPLPEVPEVEPFLAAFGPGVFDWARVVTLEAPVALDLVLAPVGEQWLVVGVLSASSVMP